MMWINPKYYDYNFLKQQVFVTIFVIEFSIFITLFHKNILILFTKKQHTILCCFLTILVYF